MGTYLITDAAEDPHRFCHEWEAAHRSRFSASRAEVTPVSPPTSRSHVIRLRMDVPQGLKSLLAVTVVADLVFYAATLQQLPYSVTHYKSAASGAVSWVSIPQYLLSWLAVSAVSPALALAAFRAVLDRRERRLGDALEEMVRRKRGENGSFTRLLPPRNWVIFPAEAALLLLLAGLLFALNFMIWLPWLGQGSQIALLVLPYLMLMIGALTVTAVRNGMRRASMRRADAQLMVSLNRIQLASRVSSFFVFPLAFYALTSMTQGISYALAFDTRIPPSLPRAFGNTLQSSSMFILQGAEPQLQTQGQFDRWLAANVLAPGSLDVALVGVVVAAVVMYLSVFRFWTLLGVNYASGEFPLNRASPPGLPRVQAGRGRAAVLVQWLFILITNLCGATVIVITALWAAHRYIYGPVVERDIILPMSALEWYKTVIAMRFGQAAAEALLALLIVPGALVLAIWAYSLIRRIVLAGRLLFPVRKDAAQRLARLRAELLRITGCRPPRIWIADALDYPKTEVMLPFRWACVIWLPRHCVENLDDARLVSVVAHELVHVRRHARRLWWLEFLSWLTITGPGLLTLLLDFAAQEFQADQVALRWTGDREAAKGALEYFKKGEWTRRESVEPRNESGRHGGPVTRLADAVRGTMSRAPMRRFRNTFFDFWTAHPSEEAVPWDERIARVTSHSR